MTVLRNKIIRLLNIDDFLLFVCLAGPLLATDELTVHYAIFVLLAMQVIETEMTSHRTVHPSFLRIIFVQ